MRKHVPFFAILLLVCNFSFAKPVFKSSKYFIACQYDQNKGALLPNPGEYKLTYHPTVNGESAPDSAYWMVQEQAPGEYSFQNAASKKYIRHNNAYSIPVNKDRWALQLVDQLQDDKSTSFSLELHQVNNWCYYSIRSVVNASKIWERRAALHPDSTTKKDVYAVGVVGFESADVRNFIFYDTEGLPVEDDYKVPVTLPKTGPSLGSFAPYLDSLTFDGKMPVVDLATAKYFLSVPESEMGKNATMRLYFKPKVASYDLYIDGEKINSGGSYTFQAVSGTRNYTIKIRQGSSVVSTGTLVFSCLPYVQIYTDAPLTAVYDLGRVVVTEPDNFTPSEVLLASLRTRGQFASRVDKKSFGIKLKDEDTETPLHRTFFGLRSDNNWVLDAMYIDPSRSRNRVSTDFWLDFSARPYYAGQEPNLVNGTRGAFVEVFVNDSYNGLYCMTEKVDKQQLKVKKFEQATATTPVVQHGSVVKADSWSDATWFGNLNSNPLGGYDNKSEAWYSFNVKYPDVADGEPFDWKPLWDAVNTVTYSATDAHFAANLETYFDMPVFLDYYLFLDLLLLTDNHGKNLYVSTYDQAVSPKMTLTPWDLDSSWGRFWDGSAGDRMKPDQTLEAFIASYVPRQSTLYKRLMEKNVWNFNNKLKTRYRELRGGAFNLTSIMDRFRNYNQLFQVSGAGSREMTRWNFTNMNSEMDFLSDWIQKRFDFLDVYYLGAKYVPIVVGLEQETVVSRTAFFDSENNKLTVSGLQTGDLVQLYTVQGLLVQQLRSTHNRLEMDLSSYPSGVYLVKMGGKIVKILKN